MRHRLGLDHVAAAQLDAIHADFPCCGVNQAFDEIVALRPPGTAIGIDGHGVGEHADHIGVDRLKAIDAGQHPGAGPGGNVGRKGGQIGAHIGHVAGAQREEAAIRVHRQLAERDVVAPMGVAQEGFCALGGPFHRAAQFTRRVAAQHMLGIDEQLHAEAAADIGGDDAEGFLVHLEDGIAQDVLQQPAALCVGAQGEAPAFELRQCGPRLHGGDDDAVVDDRQPGDMGCLGEEFLGFVLLADLPVEHLIAAQFRPDQRGPGIKARREVGGGGQGVVIDDNQLRRIARNGGAVRHDEGHRIAGMAHETTGKHGMAGIGAIRSVLVLHQSGTGQTANAVRVKIGNGVDAVHAGHALGRIGVDGDEAGGGMRAAQHHADKLAGQRHVIGVRACALEQARVFHATNRLCETELGHGDTPQGK